MDLLKHLSKFEIQTLIWFISYYTFIRDMISNSKSQDKDKDKNKKQKKEKKDKKHKKEKKRQRSNSSQSRQHKQRQRQRQRQKKKKQKKSRHKERSRSRQKERKKKVSSSPQKPKVLTQEERAAKMAMRQVKARLLKLNEALMGENDSESDSDQQKYKPSNVPPKIPVSILPPPPPPPPPKSVQSSTSTVVTKPKKKQSKWGKVSSSEPSMLHTQEVTTNEANKKLSLEPDQSQDHLKLSEDKSIQIEQEHHQIEVNLETIDEEDPLDQFMHDIEGQAVPQMDLAMKPKANVVTFEQIVAKQFSKPQQIKNQFEQQEQRTNFFEALNKLDDKKKEQKQDNRGTVMQLNEEQKQQLDQYMVDQAQPQLDFFAKQRKLAQRKELSLVDHSTIQYEQVRFNLYREAQEVKNYNHKDVIKYRKQAGDIKVRGKQIPNPIFNWCFAGFSDKALHIIEKRQYKKPFPIQAQALPCLLSGRDVIGIAETGSGKTLAYLLPLIKHVQDQRRVEEGEGPIGLIMTPTRELTRQVYLEAKIFCKPLGIRVLPVYGGLQVQKQLANFRNGNEIVICTPGRMIDILTLNKGRITNLKRVTYLVIDEADRMFDLGFQPQITRIIDNVRPKRQVALFSATFPKNVEILAKKVLNRPVEIIVGSRGQACSNVEQIVEVRQQSSKFLRLLQILGVWNQKGSILIFVDKQTQADYVFQELLRYGYNALVLHGAMDATDRQFTIYDFKKRVVNIMIATSVCARGLDIRSIVLVINFKCPNHLEDYIHRIGRTGRGGNKGTAITFITQEEEQYSIDLLKALEMAEIQPTEQLKKMSQIYLSKVKKGQARKIRNRNLIGKGYKFDEEEQEKAGQFKDMIKKQLKSEGLGFDDSDEDDIENKKKKEQSLRNRSDQDRIAEAIKNPQIKNKLLSEAVKKVGQAIKNGSALTTAQLLDEAVKAMKDSITKIKANTSDLNKMETVGRIINDAQSKNSDNSDFFSYDYEINDYPLGARQKACNQQFLNGIQHNTNCSISLRGVYVQPGKKPQYGNRKLYLHISGENKYYVTEAYKDVKKVLEQSAFQNMHMGMAPGKYSL